MSGSGSSASATSACPWRSPSPRPGTRSSGLDLDPAKVEALNAGRSYIEDVPDSALAPLGQRLRASADYADLVTCEAVIVCVPTPLTSSREPDLTYLLEAATSIAGVLERRPARRARVDHLPGHHPRAADPDPRGAPA